ncbi:MAG: hypothetical protein IPL51_09835 [Candidatus Competibacteraceae bacterium]|nr:hypothetical protein [Candidatus Competibacteraceae bacterium]
MNDPLIRSEQRAFHRLEFPSPDCSRIGRQRREGLDRPARGLRLLITGQPLSALDEVARGQRLFRSQTAASTRDLAARIQNGEIAPHLPDGDIPAAIFHREERHLLNRYRSWAKLRPSPPLELDL